MAVDLSLPELSDGIQGQIRHAITSAEISYTLDGVTQLTVNLSDPDLRMFRANHFQVRRRAEWSGQDFEIGATSISQGTGSDAQVTLELRRHAIQAMKRDKNPGAYNDASPTEYAKALARKYGLGFEGKTNAPVNTTFAATDPGSTAVESAWDVLRRAASTAQFSVFEADGVLYFGPQEWLLGKWANVKVLWRPPANEPFQLLQIPTCRRSDDDAYQATFEGVFARPNAMNLRAGMTMWLGGMGEFDRPYLITEVRYPLSSPDPVTVSARVPEQIVPIPPPPAPYTEGSGNTPPAPDNSGPAPSGSGWRVASCLLTLKKEIDARWPNRDRATDGFYGTRPGASYQTDHEPWITDPNGQGVVRAYDIDADGIDTYQLADYLRRLGQAGDVRLINGGYVIYNRLIASESVGLDGMAWSWRPYNGASPHIDHIHLSVSKQQNGYDNIDGWGL